jgi:hypothetical protein
MNSGFHACIPFKQVVNPLFSLFQIFITAQADPVNGADPVFALASFLCSLQRRGSAFAKGFGAIPLKLPRSRLPLPLGNTGLHPFT